MSTTPSIREMWDNPPALLRGAPFWSWNSKLEPDRLGRQIEDMHKAGMGGFFMHSRYGLKTPYLGEEWFRCVDACIEKAKELGLKAYLYDEDRWPSGPAGGLVTRAHPELRLHYLSASDANAEGDAKKGDKSEARAGDVVEQIACFAIERDTKGLMTGYRRVESTDPVEGATIFAFTVNTIAPTPWTNDGGYIDTMNPEAVDEFIRVTHEAYAARYQQHFGDLVPAFFTDEPEYGFWIGGPHGDFFHSPWTLRFPDEFKKRRGYDIVERLPEILFPMEVAEFSKTRYDYYRTLTEMFVECFAKRVGDWCEKHHIALTGHVLLEGQIDVQMRAVGFTMPFYEYMQWPGMDLLADQVNELTTAKQVSSVADQLGKERVLSETYGCTGWDWPLEGHKFLGDWQFAAGVNFRNHHLSHYSLAGGAKRDYPASICAHSPWWPYYGTVEDYFSRLTVMVTRGKPIRDVLVVHPIETAWGEFSTATFAQHDRAVALEKHLERVIYTLSGEHYDWDFGDESLLAKYARIDGTTFQVGRMGYRLVIVPYARTLRSETEDLLLAFIKAGGNVLLIGETPTHVDGVSSDTLEELVSQADTVDGAIDAFIPAIEGLVPRRVSLVEDGREQRCFWTMLRRTDKGFILFVQSHDRQSGHTATIRVRASGPVGHWDLITGERHAINAKTVGDCVEFPFSFAPSGSAVFSFEMDLDDAHPMPPEPVVSTTMEAAGPFPIMLNEPNTLPLDYCVYRFGEKGDWSDLMPTLQADSEVRSQFGLEPRIGNDHQPWYLYTTGMVDTTPRGHCEMKWTFHVTEVPSKCALALEGPNDFTITVNGKAISGVTGYWVDEDIQTIDVTDCLMKGDNEVLLQFDYRPDIELEDLYLVGDFGVATKNTSAPAPGAVTLIAPPKQLELGSWVPQGLLFYGGAIKYETSVQAPPQGKGMRIRLPGVSGTMAVIHVNDESFVLPWAPFAADITKALKPGQNTVVVEVVGGRKNILGPLHTPRDNATGPGHFDPRHPRWTQEYQLNDHGLMQPIQFETIE